MLGVNNTIACHFWSQKHFVSAETLTSVMDHLQALPKVMDHLSPPITVNSHVQHMFLFSQPKPCVFPHFLCV